MIKTAKLISGEFVIGRVVDTYLSNVMLIRFNANQQTGELSKQLIPYMAPLSNNVAKLIPMDKVICIEDPDEELTKSYTAILQNIITKLGEKLNEQVGQQAAKNTNQPNPISTPGGPAENQPNVATETPNS